MDTYDFKARDRLLKHANHLQQLLRDYPDKPNLEIEAMIASGDCFITLATMLDNLDELPGSVDVSTEVERIIKVLLYLQRHYSLAKKPANYQQ